jgi:serine/threonine protein kinase
MQTLEKQLSKLEKVSFGSISVGDVVGKGRFKRVHQGRYKGRDVVILRYAKDPSRSLIDKKQNRRPHSPSSAERPAEEERDRNFNELRILTLLANSRGNEMFVPEIYGACHEPHSTIIVQEFASWGTMKGHMQNSSLRAACTNMHKLHCIVLLCRAMDFLQSEHVIHADLSLRNVLLFRFDDVPHQLVAKVSDFGLSVLLKPDDDSVIRKQPQATRWCPPETVARNKLSHRSDVWSLGVTIWELYAAGALPWRERAKRIQVAARLKDIAETGGVGEGGTDVSGDFPCDPDCPQVVHRRILSCLRSDENARPKFAYLTAVFGRIIEDGGEVDSLALEEDLVAASSSGERLQRDMQKVSAKFEFSRRHSSVEPESAHWRMWSKIAETDENVAKRLEVLLGFSEADRQILLEVESRILMQKEALTERRKCLSSVNPVRSLSCPRLKVSPLPSEVPGFASDPGSVTVPVCTSASVTVPVCTTALALPGLASSTGVLLSSPPITPRQAPFSSAPLGAQFGSPMQRLRTLADSTGAWMLWIATGSAIQHVEFKSETDAMQAFRAAQASGTSCKICDPSGRTKATESWKSSPYAAQESAPSVSPSGRTQSPEAWSSSPFRKASVGLSSYRTPPRQSTPMQHSSPLLVSTSAGYISGSGSLVSLASTATAALTSSSVVVTPQSASRATSVVVTPQPASRATSMAIPSPTPPKMHPPYAQESFSSRQKSIQSYR